MKKGICGFIVLMFVLAVQVVGPTAVEAKSTIKLAHVCTLEDIFHLQAVRFKELVEQKTGGQVEIAIFPNKQLGEKETI